MTASLGLWIYSWVCSSYILVFKNLRWIPCRGSERLQWFKQLKNFNFANLSLKKKDSFFSVALSVLLSVKFFLSKLTSRRMTSGTHNVEGQRVWFYPQPFIVLSQYSTVPLYVWGKKKKLLSPKYVLLCSPLMKLHLSIKIHREYTVCVHTHTSWLTTWLGCTFTVIPALAGHLCSFPYWVPLMSFFSSQY
jgi:hypothetical protein